MAKSTEHFWCKNLLVCRVMHCDCSMFQITITLQNLPHVFSTYHATCGRMLAKGRMLAASKVIQEQLLDLCDDDASQVPPHGLKRQLDACCVLQRRIYGDRWETDAQCISDRCCVKDTSISGFLLR